MEEECWRGVLASCKSQNFGKQAFFICWKLQRQESRLEGGIVWKNPTTSYSGMSGDWRLRKARLSFPPCGWLKALSFLCWQISSSSSGWGFALGDWLFYPQCMRPSPRLRLGEDSILALCLPYFFSHCLPILSSFYPFLFSSFPQRQAKIRLPRFKRRP